MRKDMLRAAAGFHGYRFESCSLQCFKDLLLLRMTLQDRKTPQPCQKSFRGTLLQRIAASVFQKQHGLFFDAPCLLLAAYGITQFVSCRMSLTEKLFLRIW